jgi:hypothetical protein
MSEIRRAVVLFPLAVCLSLSACKSGPTSSSPDDAALLKRKAGHIEGLLARRDQAAGVLDALIKALPQGAWLTEAAYDTGKVRANGIAPSNIMLADYILRLGRSQALGSVNLTSSTIRMVRGQAWVAFAFEAGAHEAGTMSAPSETPSAAHVAKLEKSLPPRPDSAGVLRDFQRLASDAGLQLGQLASGAEVAGEFTASLPVMIEVSGGGTGVAEFLHGAAELPGLWIVEKFSCKAAPADDPRAPVRAAITAKAYFPK